jgi:predicted TIM-barrel fold metal-dependent hydrolase
MDEVKQLRAHGPHFVQDPPGRKGLYMVFDGHEPDPVGMTFTAGVQKEAGGVRKMIENFKWEDWRGPWDPSARLSDMDLDGVKMEVLYPSMARNFYSLKGDEVPLQQAGLKSYNDWLRDYCEAAPDRLLGLGLLSALDVVWSVDEMKRCAELGHKGVVLPSGLPEGMSYADPDFDRLWAAAQDLNCPIHFHVNILQGRDRMAARLKVISPLQQGRNAVRRGILEPLALLTDLVFGGVLNRFPKLHFVFAEYELSWLFPFFSKMAGPSPEPVPRRPSRAPSTRCRASASGARCTLPFKTIGPAFSARRPSVSSITSCGPATIPMAAPPGRTPEISSRRSSRVSPKRSSAI